MLPGFNRIGSAHDSDIHLVSHLASPAKFDIYMNLEVMPVHGELGVAVVQGLRMDLTVPSTKNEWIW